VEKDFTVVILQINFELTLFRNGHNAQLFGQTKTPWDVAGIWKRLKEIDGKIIRSIIFFALY
jgi:hypothetical protein